MDIVTISNCLIQFEIVTITFILLIQGWRKLFITGQAKLNLSTIQLNVWVADILFLSVISLKGQKITLPLCLLLSVLHNRIPCKHNVSDNIAPLDMLFLSIIVSLTSPKITLALFFIM